jgi:hypothetical protein
MDKILAKQPLTVPTLLVHSLWDAEDIYGAGRRLQGAQAEGHGRRQGLPVAGSRGTTAARSATAAAWARSSSGRDTAKHWRQECCALPGPLPEGRRRRRHPHRDGVRDRHQQVAQAGLVAERLRAAARSAIKAALRCAWPRRKLSFGGAAPMRSLRRIRVRSRQAGAVPPAAHPADTATTKPGRPGRAGWSTTSARPRAAPTSLTFVQDVLTAPVKISGEPVANLIASTSGTDSDWVVKLIDVYPDQVGGQPEMGGYQLMVAGHLPRPLPRELRAIRRRSRRASPCPTASACRPRTTCSCRATGSWCRCSPAGSRCTTATRRPSCRTSSSPSRRTTRRRRSGCSTRAPTPASRGQVASVAPK